MASNSSQTVTYEILVQASQVVVELDKATKAGASMDTVIGNLTKSIKQMSVDSGVSTKFIMSRFEELNNSLKNTGGILGAASNSVDDVNTAFRGSVSTLNAVKQSLENTAGAALNLRNVLRLALGVLESVAIFQAMQAITQFFTTAIKYANEYYQAVLNITVAQDAMARQGVATTNKELLDTAKDLEETFKIFSEKDMVMAVSQAALLTSQYRLSKEQLEQVVKMAGVLAATHGGTPDKYIDDLIRSAMGASSRTGVQYGIRLTEEQIKAEAVRMGIASENEKLTEQQKLLAGLSLEWDRLGGQMDKVSAVQSSVLGAGREFSSAWENALTKIGALFGPLIAFAEKFGIVILRSAQESLFGEKGFIKGLEYTFSFLAAGLTVSIQLWNAMNEAIHGNVSALGDLNVSWSKAFEQAQQYFQTLMQHGGIDISQNTPVSAVGNETPTVSIDYSNYDDALKAYQDYANSMEKAAQDHENKMYEMQAHYDLNRQQVIENTNLQIAQAQENFRLKQQQEEQQFQQKMRDLQARYLLDLEDALRKRDAEAVLRLIKKYNLEKNSAEQNHILQQNQEKAQEELRIKQMKEAEALRLKQMEDEFNLQQQLENRRYAQQQQDLAAALDQKLQEIAAKLAEEFGLNQDGQQKLYELFKEYFGTDGKLATAHLDAFLAMKNASATIVGQMEAIVNQYVATVANAAATVAALGSMGGWGTFGEGATSQGYMEPIMNPAYGEGGGNRNSLPATTMNPLGRQARGSISVANRSTSATFGESGVPELAMFLPLNSAGGILDGVSNLLGSQRQSSMGGMATVRVQLEDGLRADIVDAATTQVAVTIERVNRSRV